MDRLEILIEAQASAAIKQLNQLDAQLGKLQQRLAGMKVPAGLGLTGNGTSGTASQTTKLSTAFRKLNKEMLLKSVRF